MPRYTLGVSYFGEMIKHPGFAVEFSFIISPQYKTDVPASQLKHLFLAGIELSSYFHKKSSRSVSVTPQLQYQFLFKKGFMVGVNTGVGYMRQFNTGNTYKVKDTGVDTKIKLAGRNKLHVSGSISVGQNLIKQKNIPWGWHIDLGVFTESPSNTGYILHAFTKIGINYYLTLKKK